MLRAAAERYPNSVSIRFDLATSCESMSPPRNLEALEQYAALAALKPNALLFQYQLGTTFAALGDVTQAILIHRKAAERGSVVSARAMGQLYLEDLHDLDGAIASYRRALELASTTPLGAKGYTFMSERELGRVLRLKAIQDRLPRLLGGEDRPASAGEALDVAALCAYERMYTDGTRFYAQAFALDSTLADGSKGYNRYNAACCAARRRRPGEGRGRAR